MGVYSPASNISKVLLGFALSVSGTGDGNNLVNHQILSMVED